MTTPLAWAVVQAVLDPVVGSEQGGVRPVLVVSNDDFNQALSNVTVLPLTSTRRALYPSEVLVPAGGAGQPLDSIVMAHQIRTISKQRVRQPLGYLDDRDPARGGPTGRQGASRPGLRREMLEAR